MQKLRVASRKSTLALTQTHWVMDQLTTKHHELSVEVVPIVTKGDRILDVTLSKVGGKGLFVSEIEHALLAGDADFAVHSLKDVPAELGHGLSLSAIPVREDARDALVSKGNLGFMNLPAGSRIGTSSLRRIAQLRAVRPDLKFESIRGNIDTRLRKLETEGLDGIILAAAGLRRMGWAHHISEYLAMDICLPAIGQGLLGIESRNNDPDVTNVLWTLSDPQAWSVAAAERSLLRALNGSCQVPIGGFAELLPSGQLRLEGMVANEDGTQVLRAVAVGQDPDDLGLRVAENLRSQGAGRLLNLSAQA
jgi:hydroxymethylbilane synthase